MVSRLSVRSRTGPATSPPCPPTPQHNAPAPRAPPPRTPLPLRPHIHLQSQARMHALRPRPGCRYQSIHPRPYPHPPRRCRLARQRSALPPHRKPSPLLPSSSRAGCSPATTPPLGNQRNQRSRRRGPSSPAPRVGTRGSRRAAAARSFPRKRHTSPVSSVLNQQPRRSLPHSTEAALAGHLHQGVAWGMPGSLSQLQDVQLVPNKRLMLDPGEVRVGTGRRSLAPPASLGLETVAARRRAPPREPRGVRRL
mmetsp:Transcript_3401/g.6707  ORF Transcript_3401/g.6707 Transcript_3401/m.6707 type:complete len:252 (-) Transcript_3401:387-1142(-)